jgi:predicted transcriptional regulator
MGRRDYSEWEMAANGIFHLLRSFEKHQLGPLEYDILSMLWKRGSATVWEAIKYGNIRREYTTVMTTLERLHKKRLVNRTNEPNSRAFRYVPRHLNQADWQREMLIETVKHVLSMDTIPMSLSFLVGAVSEHDPRLLDDLQRLVEEKRRKCKKDF